MRSRPLHPKSKFLLSELSKRLNTGRMFLALVVLCLLAGPGVAQEKAANPAGRAILVLDASGSMWGRVENRTKVEIARESVSRLMSAWNPDIELGLMAYGHRREGDCNDIEMLLPVGRQMPAAVTGAVNRLDAKGKTPLSAAVKRAAEALRYTSERATVILVSDGAETCGQNPCALAEALERDGVAFTAHVIGLDLKKEETAGLQCLAEGTGGLFLEAVDAASLTKALTTVEQSVAASPPAPKVPPATALVAVLTEGSPPLTDREINWTFTSAEKGPDGAYKMLEQQRTTNPQLRYQTGKYRVVVQTGLVTRETTIDIDTDNPKGHVIDLRAGQVKLVGLAKEGGEQIKKDIQWFINEGEPGPDGKHRNITHNNDPSPTYTLSAGTYQIVLQADTAQAVAPVEVKAGQLVERKVNLNAGSVTLVAIDAASGKPFGSVYWTITRPEPNAKGEYEYVTHNSYHTPGFVLGAGRYRVVIDIGGRQSIAMINITAGDLKTIQIRVRR